MLLTCNSCRNTYVIDDATLETSGGKALCEQCHVPLVPLNAGGGSDDKTTILDGYNFGNLESQWQQQQLGPPDPMPPSFGMPPGAPGDFPDAPAPPPGFGGFDPTLPPQAETQAMEPISAGGPVLAPQERTMAFDVDALGAAAPPPAGGPPAPRAPSRPSIPAAKEAQPPAPQAAPLPPANPKARQVIIGGGGAPVMHNEKTAAIDAADIERYANSRPAPSIAGPPGQAMAQQPKQRQIPGQRRPQPRQMNQAPPQKSGRGLLFALIGFFAFLLVGGGVTVILLFVLADDDKKSKGGDEEVVEETYSTRLTSAKSAPSMFLPPSIEGEMPEDGTIVVTSIGEGVYVESNLTVSFSGGRPTPDAFLNGTPYLAELGNSLKEGDASLPVILLFDQGLPLDAVFPVIYTAKATGRRALLAGNTVTNPSLVATIEVQPFGWPDPPEGSFLPPSKNTDLRLEIDDQTITGFGKGINPTGIKKNELKVEKLIGAYDTKALISGLAAAKSATKGLTSIRLSPSKDLSYGDFIAVTQKIRGEDHNFPRFSTIYMENLR